MFYESWGPLLERADQVLRSDVREHVSDPRARAELDAVATLVGDLAAMWPMLFAAVVRETEALSGAAERDTDPLRAHRHAVHAFDAWVEQVDRLDLEQRAARRRAILATAEIEGEILQPAAARAAESSVKRI